MTNHRGKVLIAGGGIAGLACAIALRRAGLDPAVVEARPASDCGAGVFLTLAANGLDALRTLGIEPADLGGFDTDRIGLYLSDGTRLTEFPTAPKRHDGLVAQTVRRSGVYAALRREAERLGIATQYGRRVVAARPVAAGVALDFDDGQACVASLLVGADGVHSRVRRLIDARAPDPRETDLMNTAAIARDIDVEGEPGAMRMYFGRRCFFAYVPRRRGEVWWFANPPAPFHVDHGEPGKWKGRLADMFTEDAFPAREIILATDLVPAP